MIPASLLLENSLNWFFFRSDDAGKIVYCNELFESYIDHIQPNTVGDLVKLEKDKDKVESAMEKAKAISPFPVRVQCRILQNTGAYRWSTWEISYGDNLHHWIGVQLFDVVSIAAHEHEEQARLLEKIAWHHSHKIRRPLSNILGVLGLMEKSTGPAVEELVPMLSTAAKELDEEIKNIVNLTARPKDS
jgi:hypothetical protein